MVFKRIQFLFPLLFAFVFLSCEKDNEQLCDGTPVFDIEKFIENVESTMNDQINAVPGYQFVVNKDGNLYHSHWTGFAVHPFDIPSTLNWTEDMRMNMASISKFVAAIALHKAMEENGVSAEFQVVNYLPESWQSQVHPAFGDVDSDAFLTFRQLLRMESAITFPGSDPDPGNMLSEDEMLQALTQPPSLNRIGMYQNGNFTLIRVLIGEIVFELDETLDDYSTECSDKYYEYVKQNILDPIGLNCPSSEAEIAAYYADGVYPYAYQWPLDLSFSDDDGNISWSHGNASIYENAASGGMIMSAKEVARLMAFFKHDNAETIISATKRDYILTHEQGLTESVTGDFGRYQSKGGTRGPQEGTERALRSRMMFFPNDVEAVIFCNANRDDLGQVLQQSYDDAWTNPCD
jgi:CubicO group peptidase (beta-lactamase class C family)